MLGLSVKQMKIDVKGETATVTGEAASQAEREKVLLAVGTDPDKIDPGQVLRIPKA